MLALLFRNYEFTYVNSMAGATRSMGESRFDLYILDNWLPDGSGIDLCKTIRTADSQVPIIFTSAAAYSTDIDRALSSGANRYLVKPYEPLSLEKVVKELLSPGSGPKS